MKKSNVVLYSRSIEEGGAARAAARWVDALNCHFVVENPNSIKFCFSKIAKIVEQKIFTNWNSGLYGPTSLSIFSSISKKDVKESQETFFFIHWAQSNFMSIFLLSNVSKQTIFYVHDEWLLTGLGHYLAVDSDLPNSKLINYLQNYKRRQILENCIAVIAPSKWLESKFRELDLNLRTKVIPNPVPDLFLQPQNFIGLREKYGFSLKTKIVLLVSDSNIQDPRKGILGALEIIRILQTDLEDLTVFFVGRSNAAYFDGVKNIVDFGYVNNDNKLREIYNMANCTLVPSLIDNFPQTSTESQATGTPVVVYNSGGSPETVLIPNVSGKIVPPDDWQGYLDAVRHFLELPIQFQLSQREGIQFEAKLRWSSDVAAEKFHNFLGEF
jgi:glycosyltransferase involved in cell wall biosynthesis